MRDPADLRELTAAEAARLIRRNSVSPLELAEALVARSSEVEPQIEAWETLVIEDALRAAQRASDLLNHHDVAGRPLFGVPFGVKDIIDTAGVRTAADFGPYDRRVPARDAAVVKSLRRAGAILLGKTTTAQFAYRDPPRTSNPWSPAHTPGGSSSGSGAAVAAREVPIAVASQSGGSTLRPAAFCGVVGFKPTRGLISTAGLLPLAWSLDQVGVIARAVADCRLFLAATVPARRKHSIFREMKDASHPIGSMRGPVIGVMTEAVASSSPMIQDSFGSAMRRLEFQGADVREVPFAPRLETMVSVHRLILQAEASAIHERMLDRHRDAYKPELRAFLEVGELIPAAAYAQAIQMMKRIRIEAKEAFSTSPVLALPVCPDPIPGRETTGSSSLLSPFTLLGVPSIAIPTGLSRDGLPEAIQLVSSWGNDGTLLSTAEWCEERLGRLPSPAI